MTMKTTAYTRKITTNGTTRTTKTTGTTRTTEKTRTSRTTETTGTNSTTAATTGTTRATRTTGTKRANEITYTILKDSSTPPPPPPPQLRAFFTKLNYNNTHYRTSKAKKQHNHYLNLEVNILFEFCYNALIFKILCVINSLKLLVHLVLSKTLHQQT